jgi:hypothetical protein
MGVTCRGDPHKGTPNSHPNGGEGCNVDLGYRGGVQFHDYMCDSNYDTYIYVCEGNQHSSSDRFAHRTWFRSPDSQKEW